MHLILAGIIKFPKRKFMLHKIPTKINFCEMAIIQKKINNTSILAEIMIFN
jgi:hypothetical protein